MSVQFPHTTLFQVLYCKKKASHDVGTLGKKPESPSSRSAFILLFLHEGFQAPLIRLGDRSVLPIALPNLLIFAARVCQKPQPPLLLQTVLLYTSNLYCDTPPICIAVPSVPLSCEEREILSVLLPSVSRYTSHLH